MENEAASISENRLTGGSMGGKNLVSFQTNKQTNKRSEDLTTVLCSYLVKGYIHPDPSQA